MRLVAIQEALAGEPVAVKDNISTRGIRPKVCRPRR